MSLNWNSLFSNGSIIDLDTSKWGARTKLKPADLGIDDVEAVQKALSLGQVRLMPAKAFRDINQAIRDAKSAIEDSSINFALIRGARYIPDANMGKLRPQLTSAKNSFLEAVDKFCEGYQAARDEQLPMIRQAIEATGSNAATVTKAYNRVVAAYPTAAEVRAKFNMGWDVYTIQGARSRAALAAVTEEHGKIKSVVSGMVGDLRKEISEQVSHLLKAATKGGKLRKTSLESSMKMIERLRTLNVLGDESLTQQLNALEALFNDMDKQQMDEIFVAGLEGVKSELEASAEQAIADVEANLSQTGRRKLA